MLDREQYDQFRVSPADPAMLRCHHVERILLDLSNRSGGRLRIEKFAESVAGRPIYLATTGTGACSVLLWTQMHGDEPTHTAVVLDLLSYLLQTPATPQATDLLANCTLHILPMLNPDGAEAFTRFNAQGIDVNRDALRLASPEGRALRRAVDTLKPQFGFNLHNQNARTSVGNPPRPAAVSVLAPPPDARRTETPAMRRGKQLCACFVEAVRPYAARMISRYDDTYEPRAFGDTIQSLGTATMLVEAGGWHEPDPEPLTRLHFHGLLATLHAIATGKFEKVNIDAYETLPTSNARQLFDCVIAGGHVFDPVVPQPFRADLAIEQSHGQRIALTSRRDGKLADLGDLSTTAAKLMIDAEGCLILPGRITVLDDWNPATPLDDRLLDSLLAFGATTAVGTLDLADRDALEAIGRADELPLNWGFVGRLNAISALPRAEWCERLAVAASRGMLAVVGQPADESLWHYLDALGLPLLKPDQLAAQKLVAGSYRELTQQAAMTAKLLNVHNRRGRVARDYFADLQVFDLGGQFDGEQTIDWRRLSRVIVSGETVWNAARRSIAKPGVLLRSR